jgi:hypothetical protein
MYYISTFITDIINCSQQLIQELCLRHIFIIVCQNHN